MTKLFTREKNSLRFSLKSLLVVFALVSVLCAILVVLAPPVFALASELLAMRAIRKFVFAVLGLAAVFVGVLVLALLFRFTTLIVGASFERPCEELPANNAKRCE